MPVWGTVLLAVLAGWLLLSALVALGVGRAIRMADRRSPRKPRARTAGRRLRAVPPPGCDVDTEDLGERRQQPRG
ncbi:hypothetical protein [Amnibacterium sp.]|uniref:hypothetical protein n=1 Tax=Amnibacterium sp. TaxID=1872496 RepID=UPI002618B748|nr:hypothetical protein [Amnibacterium sp.]